MSPIIWIIIIVVVAAICLLIGYILRKNIGEKAIGSAEQKAKNLILDAENRSETIKKEITLEAPPFLLSCPKTSVDKCFLCFPTLFKVEQCSWQASLTRRLRCLQQMPKASDGIYRLSKRSFGVCYIFKVFFKKISHYIIKS